MPLLFSQVVEVTHDKAKQDILNFLTSIGFAATSWQEGSVVLGCVEIGALVWSKGTSVAVTLKEAVFNDTSTGDALTRFSKSHYANTRTAATTAQRTDRMTCAAGSGPYTINIGDVVIATTSGKTYRNVAGNSVIYPATLSSASPLTPLFEAEVAGAGSSAPSGTTMGLVTTFAGVTLSLDTMVRNGTDQELDATLRLDNSTKWASLGVEAIKDGLINAALSLAKKQTPAIPLAQVGVDDNNPNGPGSVDVYLATATAPLQEPDRAILDPLLKRRLFGSATLRVNTAPAVSLDLAGTVYFDASFSQTDVKAAVEAELTTFLATIPLGGFKYTGGPQNVVPKNDIEAVIKGTTLNGLKPVKTVTLSTPAADLSVSSFGKVTQGTWLSLSNYVAVTVST